MSDQSSLDRYCEKKHRLKKEIKEMKAVFVAILLAFLSVVVPSIASAAAGVNLRSAEVLKTGEVDEVKLKALAAEFFTPQKKVEDFKKTRPTPDVFLPHRENVEKKTSDAKARAKTEKGPVNFLNRLEKDSVKENSITTLNTLSPIPSKSNFTYVSYTTFSSVSSYSNCAGSIDCKSTIA